jgi:hypothetical protein
MKALGVSILFFFYSWSLIQAQPNLVLTKLGKPRHFYYQVGDRIIYKSAVTGEKFSGIIISLNDSTLELSRAPRIKIQDISVIYRTRHFLSQVAGAGVVVLGVYLPISIANRAIQGERPIIDENLLLVNGTMLGVSGLSYLFLYRKLRIGSPWRLQVLDFGKPVYD